jgi:hypothetical protein
MPIVRECNFFNKILIDHWMLKELVLLTMAFELTE